MDKPGPRICLISGEYPPVQGGVGDYTSLLAQHLAQAGGNVAIGTSAHPQLADQTGNPEVWRRVSQWDYRAVRNLALAARHWHADIVHIQYQAAAYDMRPAINLARLLFSRHNQQPRIVVTFHDLKVPYLFPKAGPLRRLAVMFLAASADAVVVTNAADARELRRDALGKHARNRVIPIGSNIALGPVPNRSAFRARLGLGADELLLAYFGFLNQRKGVDVLFRALRLLLDMGKSARLLMIGGTTGDSDPTNQRCELEIRNLAASLALDQHVLWTGYVENAEVSSYLQCSDTCVLPYRDGACYRHGTLIAAITHGLPIISTLPPGSALKQLEGVDDLMPLDNRENLLLVPSEDPAALATAVVELADSPDLLQKVTQGAATLRTQFDWISIARRNLDLYHSLLGRAA